MEVRTPVEGSLRWVVASGSGSAWATASAPTSGLMGFCTNFTFTSARTVETVMERGTPNHHKLTDKQAITFQFDVLYGITADYPPYTTTGAGASMPMVHLELKMTAPEAGSALYHQLHGCALTQQDFNETSPVNTQSFQGVALAMIAGTASGFLG